MLSTKRLNKQDIAYLKLRKEHFKRLAFYLGSSVIIMKHLGHNDYFVLGPKGSIRYGEKSFRKTKPVSAAIKEELQTL